MTTHQAPAKLVFRFLGPGPLPPQGLAIPSGQRLPRSLPPYPVFLSTTDTSLGTCSVTSKVAPSPTPIKKKKLSFWSNFGFPEELKDTFVHLLWTITFRVTPARAEALLILFPAAAPAPRTQCMAHARHKHTGKTLHVYCTHKNSKWRNTSFEASFCFMI